MTEYEYLLEVSDEPLDAVYLQNEFGIHGYKLVSILLYNEQFYYYFERGE